MKSRILIFLSVMALSFAACKKDTVNVATVDHAQAGDSLLNTKFNEELVLNPKVSGKVNSYQWLENDREIGTSSTYKFKKETPGVYTLVFKAVNEGGTSTLTYKIRVLGSYGSGVLLLSNSNEDSDGPSELSYIDEKGVLTTNVFAAANKGVQLAPAAYNMYHHNSRYYITSMNGPNHLTVVDDQTLKLDYVVTQSGISDVTHFATADGKTGFVNVTNRRKSGLYPVDLVTKTISGTALAGTKDISLVPLDYIGNSMLAGSGKQLLKIENNEAKVLYAYKENVAGVVKTANKTVWVAVQGFTNKPKFVKLDQSFKAVDSVELDPLKYKLPANGILTASGNDEYIYWQETALGVICRFNTLTKTAEEFVNFADADVLFASAWKVNPKTGDVYIASTPGIFSGETESTLFIFDKKGKEKQRIKKAGYSISDIAFAK
ncbi:DUF5074 domain-containing protein [Pedobacter caeni]|uniref:PKD-like domain-containing protein n=1 Tax=Pedobacter caeni TaxID=288992 RepID=A0A1M5F0G3_9SPHI|nr:DUF5074 domain-containing protein [Pedobacter caeni]SHF85040.1 PKD-like domain-containing protein [Pedobacter caeni]